jgi:hypothetical protein
VFLSHRLFNFDCKSESLIGGSEIELQQFFRALWYMRYYKKSEFASPEWIPIFASCSCCVLSLATTAHIHSKVNPPDICSKKRNYIMANILYFTECGENGS